MPQLNPRPWFFILVLSWLIYLMVIQLTKNLNMLNELTSKNNMYMTQPWYWPWT
uniref:ATP synthase complex subunit 8 n=1 Tax=Oedipina poelzi TaxID=107992 RepID=Q645E5_9SALA|nr:ATP synthase F0 subunit 8 [Oedipina poelzi]AAU20439.1 ATP synthase F0 subunit 8 [Oedipina poelzi]